MSTFQIENYFGNKLFLGHGALAGCIARGDKKNHKFYVGYDMFYTATNTQTKGYISYPSNEAFWKDTGNHLTDKPEPFYEIIQEALTCKLYADVEWALSWRSIDDVKKILIDLLNDQFEKMGIDHQKLEYLFIDASLTAKDKGSLHLICNEVYFNNVVEQRRFWNEIYISLKEIEDAWFIDDTGKSYVMKTFIDFGVYNKNRMMRLIYSPKMKNGVNERPLLPAAPIKVHKLDRYVITAPPKNSLLVDVSTLSENIVCSKTNILNKKYAEHLVNKFDDQVTVEEVKNGLIRLRNKTASRVCKICKQVHTDNAFIYVKGNELMYSCHFDKTKRTTKSIGSFGMDPKTVPLAKEIPFEQYTKEHLNQVTNPETYKIWHTRVMNDMNNYVAIVNGTKPYILIKTTDKEDEPIKKKYGELEAIEYAAYYRQSFKVFGETNDCHKVPIEWNAKGHPTKTLSLPKLWLAWPGHKLVKGELCSPCKTNPTKINTFRGIRITRELAFENQNEEADAGAIAFFNFYKENACENIKQFDYLINWLAHVIQNPGIKTLTVPVLKGEEGIGKGLLYNKIKDIVGSYNCLQPSRLEDLAGFNGTMLAGKLLIFMDEMLWGGNKDSGPLKKFITESTLTVEDKYGSRRPEDNVLNVIMASNEDHVIPASFSSRRYHIYEVNNSMQSFTKDQKKVLRFTCPYAIARYLYNVNIEDFEPTEGEIESSGLAHQKLLSMDSTHKWWNNLLEIYNISGNDGVGMNVLFGKPFKKEALYEHYKHHVKSYPLTYTIFWKKVRTLCDYDDKKEKKRTEDGKRIVYCVLPTIKECRISFNKNLKFDVLEIDESELSEV